MKQIKWFLTGMVTMLLIMALAGTAVATTADIAKTLQYRDIKVSLDGNVLDLKDAAGNHVEPFMFDGTNYLPVRALAEALGLNVSWDAAANTIVLSTGKAVAYYADCPNVPDFGVYAGIPCAKEMTKDSAKFYIYKTSDIASASTDAGRLFSDYFEFLGKAGFLPYDLDDGTSNICFVGTFSDKPVVVIMGPLGVDEFAVLVSKTTDPKPTPTPEGTITTGQKNAVARAKQYLSVMSFSRSGLIGQLKYEGYSEEEATYGADNCGADWNEQAAKKAQEYINLMSFSRQGLIDQLKYEGFTQSQAEYGVSKVGY